MEIQVVLGQIGEDERRKAYAVEPPELRAVRGRLHCTALVAGLEHGAEASLQVDRLRRRPDRGQTLTADPALDRPDHPWAQAR